MANMTKLDGVNEILAGIGQYPVDALDTGGVSDAAQAERYLDRSSADVQAQGWPENTEPGVTLNPPDVKIPIATPPTGTFEAGETVAESTSGAEGTFHQIIGNDIYLTTTSGTFTGGAETLTGQTSGATATETGVDVPITEGQIVVPSNVLGIEAPGLVLRGTKLYDVRNRTYTFSAAVIVQAVYEMSFIGLPVTIQREIVDRAAQRMQRRELGGAAADAFLTGELNEAENQARGGGKAPKRFFGPSPAVAAAEE